MANKKHKFEPKSTLRIVVNRAPREARYQDVCIWGDVSGSEQEIQATCNWLAERYSEAWYELVPEPRPKRKPKKMGGARQVKRDKQRDQED